MLKMNTLYLPIITSIAQKTGGWWGVRYPPFKGGVMTRHTKLMILCGQIDALRLPPKPGHSLL